MCIRPGLCIRVSVSVLRALVGCKKVWLQKSFRSIVIVNHVADRKLQIETKSHGHHFAGVQRTAYVLLPLSRPPGMPRERGERARRESEAAVKRSDLANFDPDTPLEKLHWAREEMERNFQQPMSARAMRVCTVCSERWDTAEDGGGDYRWVVYLSLIHI